MLANTAKNLLSKSFRYSLLNRAAVQMSTAAPTETAPEGTAAEEPKVIDPAEYKVLEEKLLKSEADVKDLKDKYMRALAETENVRNRMIKGVDDAKSFGIQGFCKDLLEVADILNLAIVNTNPKDLKKENETIEELNEKLTAMYNGIVMTEKCMIKIFEKNNLYRISPAEGDKFDPNFHDAIFRVPIPGKTSGTIETVTKTGYKLKERVIRAAQVGVVQ